jgi:hypothetical protein
MLGIVSTKTILRQHESGRTLVPPGGRAEIFSAGPRGLWGEGRQGRMGSGARPGSGCTRDLDSLEDCTSSKKTNCAK